MAITVNNVQTATSSTGNATSVTLSNYNVGAGTAGQRKLVVLVSLENANSDEVDDVTYGGVSLSSAVSVSTNTGGYECSTSIWYFDDTDIGSGSQTEDIVASMSGTGSVSEFCLTAYWLDEVTQGAPTQTATNFNNSASQTSLSATLNGVAADAIIVNAIGVGDEQGGTFSPDGGQTEDSDFGGTFEESSAHATAHEIPGAGNHTQGWTFSSARRPNMCLAEWAEFSGGGGVSIPVIMNSYKQRMKLGIG